MTSPLWFEAYGPMATPPRARLLCLPFGGGSSVIFRPWYGQLPEGIQLLGARLPGRGARFSEPLRRELDDLVASFAAVLPQDGVPLVLFGHSMGALLAYELCLRLEAAGRRPAGLIASGCAAPGMPRRHPDLHRLPDQDFIEHLRALNGTPAELLENDAAMLVLLPILRADFQLVETYARSRYAPVSCPIAVVGGDADPMVSSAELNAWAGVAGHDVEPQILPGDHFFLVSARTRLLQLIGNLLADWCPDAARKEPVPGGVVCTPPPRFTHRSHDGGSKHGT